jgi:hypothetical protein
MVTLNITIGSYQIPVDEKFMDQIQVTGRNLERNGTGLIVLHRRWVIAVRFGKRHEEVRNYATTANIALQVRNFVWKAQKVAWKV